MARLLGSSDALIWCEHCLLLSLLSTPMCCSNEVTIRCVTRNTLSFVVALFPRRTRTNGNNSSSVWRHVAFKVAFYGFGRIPSKRTERKGEFKRHNGRFLKRPSASFEPAKWKFMLSGEASNWIKIYWTNFQRFFIGDFDRVPIWTKRSARRQTQLGCCYRRHLRHQSLQLLSSAAWTWSASARCVSSCVWRPFSTWACSWSRGPRVAGRCSSSRAAESTSCYCHGPLATLFCPAKTGLCRETLW